MDIEDPPAIIMEGFWIMLAFAVMNLPETEGSRNVTD